MSKVKLTREQAAAIDTHTVHGLGYWFYKKYDKEHYLYKLFENHSIEDIMRAKLIGYEIKEEFKVGDWVVHDNKKIGKVKKINDDVITIDVELGYLRDDGETAYVNTLARYFRHATPEEIAKEKERRWWAKHGRKVWELKEGDCLIRRHNPHTCNVKFVEAADEDLILLVDGIRDESYETKNDLEVMMKKYEVFCFVEDRKDGRVNE